MSDGEHFVGQIFLFLASYQLQFPLLQANLPPLKHLLIRGKAAKLKSMQHHQLVYNFELKSALSDILIGFKLSSFNLLTRKKYTVFRLEILLS